MTVHIEYPAQEVPEELITQNGRPNKEMNNVAHPQFYTLP